MKIYLDEMKHSFKTGAPTNSLMWSFVYIIFFMLALGILGWVRVTFW